jgi:hypothetical protein
MLKEVQIMKKLECYYCDAVKEEISFMIGASLQPEWTMHEGTGKVSCPDCHSRGVEEAENVLRNQRR